MLALVKEEKEKVTTKESTDVSSPNNTYIFTFADIF